MEKNAAARPRAILAAGAGIQLLTGLPAAWGVFQQPVREAYALGEMGATAAFSVLIAAYGAGCVAGGFLQEVGGQAGLGRQPTQTTPWVTGRDG